MQGYQVCETDGRVTVNDGRFTWHYDPAQARRLAARLAIGAELAAQQRRLLHPRRYGFPGTEIDAGAAFLLAWQVFGQGCELDAIGELAPGSDLTAIVIADDCTTIIHGAEAVRLPA